MPIELIQDVEHDDEIYDVVDSDLIIYSVRVESLSNSLVSFRSPSDIKIQEVIDSLRHDLRAPRLCKGEKVLNSTSTLAYCEVTTGDVLQLCEGGAYGEYDLDLSLIEIRGKKKYKSFQISLRSTAYGTSISDVLRDLDAKYAERGRLVYKGVNLPHASQLSNLGIKKNEVLHFHPKPFKFKLQVPSLDGAEAFEVNLEYYHSERLLDVKAHLLQSLLPGKPLDPHSYQLLCNGTRLLETRFCGELVEQSCALLQLATVPDATILHFKTETGSFFDLRVQSSLKCGEIKEIISQKKDFPVSHQLLRFDEAGRKNLREEFLDSSRYSMEYKDPWTVAESGFEDHLPFSVYNVISGASVEIILQRYPLVITDVTNGEVFELMVKACETISHVKRKIHALVQISIEKQILTSDGDTPLDSSILCEIQLLEGARLSLSYQKATDKESLSLRPIPVDAGMRSTSNLWLGKIGDPPGTQKRYCVKVEKRSRTRAFFDRIAVLENLDVGDLRFFCDGERMKDGDRFCDTYDLEDPDEVCVMLGQIG